MSKLGTRMDQKNYALTALNERYSSQSRLKRLELFYKEHSPEEVFVTSSFGTSSAILLHHLSQVAPGQPIHFIDTGYLFPETLSYRQQLVDLLGLQVVEVQPDEAGHRYTLENRLWDTEPDVCCGINKTMPVEDVREDYKIWMAGLMAFQNPYRKNLQVFEDKGSMRRFYPILDISAEEVATYFERNKLPRHPLEGKGYGSVGCIQCSAKGQGRSGRWFGKFKTECGLHT